MTQLVPIVLSLIAIAELAVLLHAAGHDFAARTIPNTDSLVLAGLGLFRRVTLHQGLAALALAAAVFCICNFLWRRGWLGGGDVKLLTACALLVAPGDVPALLSSVMVAGGVLACVYLMVGKALRAGPRPVDLSPRSTSSWRRLIRLERWRVRRGAALPYGVAISAAAMLHIVGGWRP